MGRFLWICLGGAVGTGARFALSSWVLGWLGAGFPWGTLAVNLIGSFFLGVLMQAGTTSELISPALRLALTTGVMGGFTTYSTFNYETLESFRQGAWLMGMANIAATLFGCLIAGMAGIAAARLLVGTA